MKSRCHDRVTFVHRSLSSVFAALLVVITAAVLVMVPMAPSSWTSVSAQTVPRIVPGDRLFLKLEGIDGEVTETGHTGELALRTFSLALDRPSDSSKAQMTSFHVTMGADKASPLLMRKTVTRELVPKVVLVMRNALGQDYMKWTLANAVVTSFKVNGTAGEIKPELSFDLQSSKIDVEYRPQLNSGGLGPAVKGAWDGKIQ